MLDQIYLPLLNFVQLYLYIIAIHHQHILLLPQNGMILVPIDIHGIGHNYKSGIKGL